MAAGIVATELARDMRRNALRSKPGLIDLGMVGEAALIAVAIELVKLRDENAELRKRLDALEAAAVKP